MPPPRQAGAIETPSARLLTLAAEVRRIGDGYRCTPEDIAIRKDAVARELVAISRALEPRR